MCTSHVHSISCVPDRLVFAAHMQEGFFAGLVDVVVQNYGEVYTELGVWHCKSASLL